MPKYLAALLASVPSAQREVFLADLQKIKEATKVSKTGTVLPPVKEGVQVPHISVNATPSHPPLSWSRKVPALQERDRLTVEAFRKVFGNHIPEVKE